MSDAYIVGVDMIKFGRFPDRTVPNIGAEAALLALDDCGLNIHDMQAMYCGNLGQASAMVGQRVLTAEDVANAVVFLASPLSDLIQGETLVVDGGAAIHV